MLTLWFLICLGVIIFLAQAMPTAWRQHKRPKVAFIPSVVRFELNEESGRRIVEVFIDFTANIEQFNIQMLRLREAVREVAEKMEEEASDA